MSTQSYHTTGPVPLHGPYVDGGESASEEEDEGWDTSAVGGSHNISLGQMIPRLQPTTVASHNVTKTCNLVINSVDRNLFHEPLLSFHAHFASHVNTTGGCSIERRLRDITKVRCTQLLFPIQNEVFTVKYHNDTALKVTAHQKIHLFLDPLTRIRDEIAASGDIQDAYQIMIPDSSDYHTKFIPYDTANNDLDTPIHIQSLHVRIVPEAQKHERIVHHATTQTTIAPRSLPTLDLYPFSAIVYNRIDKTLTVTFETELDQRLIQTGFLFSFPRLLFVEDTAYERCLRRRIESNHRFVVVAVHTKGVERDTRTTERFTTDNDGYISRVITAVQLHFTFTEDEEICQNEQQLHANQYSFDLDTRKRENNIVLNHAMQYTLLLEMEYRARTLTTSHNEVVSSEK